MFAWAPGVPSIAGVDYIFEETKGEYTWAYLVDTGVAYRHWVCVSESSHEFRAILRFWYQEFQNNWSGAEGYGKTNIDEDWIYGSGVRQQKLDRDPDSHGTCMASRICGKRSGTAKQTTVIPAVVGETVEGFLSALQKVLADIPERRKKGQCLAGKTVVSISLTVDNYDVDYITLLSDTIKGIMDLGVVVVCSAGNDDEPNSDDWEASSYPAALARTRIPWLFRIGACDNKGVLPVWAQKGDVYAPGVKALCAKKDGLTLEEQSYGSSGSTAGMAGLILYEMGKESSPFEFSGREEDYPNYQQIVKEYYTKGPGAYVRPGGVWRVSWNGLDGRRSTYCPLYVQKRDDEDDNEDYTCAQPSSASAIKSTVTVQASASTSSTISSAISTMTSPNAAVLGGELAKLAAAIASSSSAAAASSSSAAVAEAASASSAQAAAGALPPSPTTTPPPSHVTPLSCTQ